VLLSSSCSSPLKSQIALGKIAKGVRARHPFRELLGEYFNFFYLGQQSDAGMEVKVSRLKSHLCAITFKHTGFPVFTAR
jgi:hypothetical protein